jgi:seryl-tRNA synthetase
MLDIQYIRENSEKVQEKTRQKGSKADVSELLKLDEKRRSLIRQSEKLRELRNQFLDGVNKKEKPSDENIAKGKKYRSDIEASEKELNDINIQFNDLLSEFPNITPDDTPLGGEEANVAISQWGDNKKNEAWMKDHLDWAVEKDLLDFERGSKVSGNKFYFQKGNLVNLELALSLYVMELAQEKGFTPISVPHMVNTKTLKGTGYLPRGEERQVYKVEGEDLNLIATAEIPITGYHSEEVIEAEQLPLLYVGISPAYRMEAGAYGKHSRGLYRVHQFNKIELYVFCKPEDSEKWHTKLVKLEEEICQKLKIPYQLVRIAAGDLGAPAYKKFDIEYWSPVDNSYKELMSCSNITDYQARRLNIRYKSKDKKVEYLHTLNGTAAAFSRMLIALIENNQTEDGSVLVPEVLQKYMRGMDKI